MSRSEDDPVALPERAWYYTPRGHALVHSWRHLVSRPLASLTTVLVLGITLALPLTLAFLAPALEALQARGIEGESLTLYLDRSLDDRAGAALATRLASRPGVREVAYVSRREALASLRENTDLDEAIDALDANPLPGAIVIYPVEEVIADASVPDLAAIFEGLAEVESVRYDLRWVRRLQVALSLLQAVGTVLAAFLVLTALLVIANTVRLDLLRRHAESEVVHLLGGGWGFRNRPFLYTGALYGLLGGATGLVLALVVLGVLAGPADELATLYDSAFRLPIPSAATLLGALAATVMLGLFGAACSLIRGSSDLFRGGRSE